MRAYHQSEISHANHAITMLLAIASALGAVTLAMLSAGVTINHLHKIAFGQFIVVLILGGTITLTAIAKIGKDHDRYKSFGSEYVRCCKALGFYSNKSEGGEPYSLHGIKRSEDVGQGYGYQKSQGIIFGFFAALILLSFLLFIATLCPTA